MGRKLVSLVLAVLMVLTAAPVFSAAEPEQAAIVSDTSRQMENLNRGGFAATNPTGGVYLSWRLLGTEPMDTVFNVYKNGVLFSENLNNTNILDSTGTKDDVYTVAPVIGGTEGEISGVFPMLTGYANSRNASAPYAYFDIPVQIPEAGTDYTYNTADVGHGESGGPNDASVGDVDGDGEYEVILKWDPSNSKDSAASGITGLVYLDCYEMDGTLLWRINLGRNIRAGAHYTQFQVFDYDGDGKAEVAVKTAPGSVDGKGNYVSDAGNTNEIKNTDNTKSYLGSNGHVTGGPEYLTIFNGETGAAMQTIDYGAPLGNVRDWGDNSYNRSDRFLAGTAYLDGVHPSILMCRGYYGKSVIMAYDWDGENLTQRWKLDSTSSSSNKFYGQGNHNLSIADLDNDGKDEIIYGSCAVDDNGTLLWSTGLGHGDALHVSDFDGDGKQEIYKVLEDKPHWGETYIEGDGTVVWHITSQTADKDGDRDDGRGIMGNFSPKYGVLAWDARNGICTIDGAVSGKGGNISKKTSQDNSWSSANFNIYWDGDLYEEHFDGNRISKWNDYEEANADGDLGGFGRFWDIPGIAYNNTTKRNPCLQADLFGDWREELILRTNDNSSLRVFTSLATTDYKFTTFMHDSQYRCAVAWQNTGYNQPPHQSYYIGYDKSEKEVTEYTQPDIAVRPLDPETAVTVKNADGTPAVGVKVNLGGIEKPTNSEGVVYYRLAAGTYSYSINQAGYYDVTGSVNVSADSANLEEVEITELPDSTITVKSGDKTVAGAAVTIGGFTAVTGTDGKATLKIKPGENDITVECKKYETYTGKVTAPADKGADVSIELTAINYAYDSVNDADGKQFEYTGGAGAELTFGGGSWTFNQNSTDGGRSFGSTFKASENGNAEFELKYSTGAVKDASDAWNWSGRPYTHYVKLVDIYGSTIIGISQEYTESDGAQETKYFTSDESAKKNVNSGEMFGGPNITKRSSSKWMLNFKLNLKDKKATLTLSDEAGENGYVVSDIPIDSTSFCQVKIGSEASGNVTWSPVIKDVLYWSDCLTDAVPTSPTPAPKPTPEPPLDEANAVVWNLSEEPFVKNGAVNTSMFPEGTHKTEDNVVDRFNITSTSIVNVNGLTYVTANTDENQFQGSNVTFDDGTACNWSLKTSKAGSDTDRVFTYTPAKAGVIRVYAKSGSSNASGVNVKQGGKTIGSAEYNIGAAAQMDEFKVQAGSEVKIVTTGNTQYYVLKFVPYCEPLSDVIGYSSAPDLSSKHVTAEIFNNSTDGTKAIFIAAAYENEVLAEAQTVIAEAGTTPVSIDFEKEYTDVKYFLWNAETYEPYTYSE